MKTKSRLQTHLTSVWHIPETFYNDDLKKCVCVCVCRAAPCGGLLRRVPAPEICSHLPTGKTFPSQQPEQVVPVFMPRQPKQQKKSCVFLFPLTPGWEHGEFHQGRNQSSQQLPHLQVSWETQGLGDEIQGPHNPPILPHPDMNVQVEVTWPNMQEPS